MNVLHIYISSIYGRNSFFICKPSRRSMGRHEIGFLPLAKLSSLGSLNHRILNSINICVAFNKVWALLHFKNASQLCCHEMCKNVCDRKLAPCLPKVTGTHFWHIMGIGAHIRTYMVSVCKDLTSTSFVFTTSVNGRGSVIIGIGVGVSVRNIT